MSSKIKIISSRKRTDDHKRKVDHLLFLSKNINKREIWCQSKKLKIKHIPRTYMEECLLLLGLH